MKKLFTFIAALMAVVAINAKQVVFDFTNPEALGITAPEDGKGTPINDSTIVIDGVTMTNTKVAKTDTRVWNSKGVYDLRIYATSTFTFAAEENINAVAFDGAAIGFNEFNGNTWTGESKSVTVTANLTCKINTITVYIGETPDVWVADTINVAQARALIAAEDKHDHFVKGIVASQPFNTFDKFEGKVSFYLVDALEGDSLQAYQVLDKNNAKWASLEAAWEELRIGDTVLVYAGGLKLYAAKNIYEIDPGYYDSKLGANPNPPEIIYPQIDTITVAEALEIGNALEAGAKTADDYVVAGYVVKAYEPNEGYTDQTWYMADEAGAFGEFQAYQCTPDSLVKKDDFVYVKGKIMKYVKEDKVTIEISKGTATHGVAPAPVELDPITVAQALEIGQALGDNTTTGKPYSVKGYVVKAFEYSTEYQNQDFYMADELGAYGEFYAFHAKPAAPVNEGDLIILTGKIKKYVNKDGTKTTIEIEYGEVEVVEAAQGIENIVLTEKAKKVMVDGVMYIVRDNKMYDVRGTQIR